MLEIRAVTLTYPGPGGVVTAVAGVDLDVQDGEVLALLGPSGCGKSTLLRAIAGLEPVAAGQICWDGTDLVDIPVHRRGFGLMFQDGVLFPHRDVAGNIAYGLRRAGLDRAEITSRVGDLLELVGLPGFGDRRVATLSGGEAQRVALARALAPRPRLLLLDEPLAALDRALRERLLVDLRSVLTTTRTTAVFVTHDQGEAFAVADRLAVMRAGGVQQVGPARDVWARPANAWVAGFVGYRTVLTGDAGVAIGLGAPPPGALWALRPAALVIDGLGAIAGEVMLAVSSPDGLQVTVRIDGVGVTHAVAPSGANIAVGDVVGLRLDRAGAVLVPSGIPAGSSSAAPHPSGSPAVGLVG